MSSKSSSKTGPQFKFTQETASEAVGRTAILCKQEQQMQLLLQQHHFLLQHFAFGENNNAAQFDSLYRIPQPTTTTSTSLMNLTPPEIPAQFFHAKHFHQLISNISHHQQQQQQQQNYENMMTQPVDCSTLPIIAMENVALTTPPIQADNKPDIEALNDLTARIPQTSSPAMSLFEMYAKSPQLIQDVSLIKATTTKTTTATTIQTATSTSSLTAAPSSTVSAKTTKSHNFNMSLDPQYQLQRHQQQQQQQENQPTKQDHEKQTILLRHNEMAHAIDSSMLPPAKTTTTETAEAAAAAEASSSTTKTSSEVASLVLTVATPPVDIQTLRANCKGG